MTPATPFRHKPDSLPGRSRQSAVKALPSATSALCPHKGGPASPSAGPSIRELILVAEIVTGVAVVDIMGQERVPPFAMARVLICACARRMGYSLQMIGRHLGGRDHTTIMAAARNEARALEYFGLPEDFRLAGSYEDDGMIKKRISDDVRQAIMADFSAGMRVMDIVEKYRVGKTTVRTICSGINRGGKRILGAGKLGTIGALTPDQQADLLRKYARRDSNDSIAREFGLTTAPEQITKFASIRGVRRGSDVPPVMAPPPEPVAPKPPHPVLQSHGGFPAGSYRALSAFAAECGMKYAGALQLWHKERRHAKG